LEEVTTSTTAFSQRILVWFDQHGRHDLPWQQDINPYRVWVSEIMLQQTQVKTVIPYFQRFMAELPTVESLARADEDQVLHLWTGLGYYSRARNLHKTAQRVCEQYDGQFPDTVDLLSELPGIGRSTAGAIVSIAFQKQAAILDGNVKRVLARHHAIEGWPGQSQTLKTLWQIAEQHNPEQRVADYSQAMMDLGATLCTRSKPACPLCPLVDSCEANRQSRQTDFPGKKPKRALPVKTSRMLIVENPRGEILLEKRPPSGIWGSLWCFPMTDDSVDQQQLFAQLKLDIAEQEDWSNYRHSFSHYHLDIIPVKVKLNKEPPQIMAADQRLWYNLRQPQAIGLSAPVKKLLGKLK
jgi:A/G-specific adenine glycosylase